MVILEIAQWGLLLYLAWILYQCYKTSKSMVELESTVRKHFQDEFKSIYKILNKIENDQITDTIVAAEYFRARV